MNEQDRHDGQKKLRELAGIFAEKLDPALLATGGGKLLEFMECVGASAPRVRDADGQLVLRWQDAIIEEEIAEGSSVLDLGCGGGDLLAKLICEKHVLAQGVELDPEAVLHCVRRGVPVFHSDLDQGLSGFSDCSFDHVILEETLQTLHRPIGVLEEMLRVGRTGIVSFPNFAYWRVRLDLALQGRMPVTDSLPHRWYDTPNIHLFSLQDFLEWADAASVSILHGYALVEGEVREVRDGDNLHAEEVLLVVTRNRPKR